MDRGGLIILSNELKPNSMQENKETIPEPHSSFINAFQLIAMSHDLDLSGLFEEMVSLRLEAPLRVSLDSNLSF